MWVKKRWLILVEIVLSIFVLSYCAVVCFSQAAALDLHKQAMIKFKIFDQVRTDDIQKTIWITIGIVIIAIAIASAIILVRRLKRAR